jgi:galactokinase
MKKLDLEAAFQKKFGTTCLIVRSPGRVNLIGEHTDYNDGFVLPAAIDKAAYVAIAKRTDNKVVMYATAFNQDFETSLKEIKTTTLGWPNYILGVIDQIQKTGLELGGCNLLIDGDIPIGAGLSSSAALECATLFALNELFGLQFTKLQMAFMAQKAEHDFAGVHCGLMDMFASLFGKKDHVIKLDCRSLEYEYVPLDIKGYKILLLNTNVKHVLSSSEYNTRRIQCEQGITWIQQQEPTVNSLRDATIEMLEKYVLPKDLLIYNRCKYVVEENSRLISACADLKNGDIEALGKQMFATHEGLKSLYEVSCPELDFLVDQVKGHPAVLGARMMGGDFGGCTINIVKEEAIESLVAMLEPLYEKHTQKQLSHYIASIEEGTSIL